MGKFFIGLYQFITRHRPLSGIGLLLVVLGLVMVASKIEFEEDISKLIPIHSENQDLEKVLKTVNFTDKIMVNIQQGPQGSLVDMTSYATQFLDSLDTSSKEFIKNIQGKVQDEDIEKTLDFVYENLPLFLDTGDYSKIRQKLSKDSITHITKENYKTLISPSGIVAKKIIIQDPLGLSFMALKKLQQLGVGDGFKLVDGFLVSKDEQNIILFLTPRYPSNETAKNEVFVDNIYRVQNRLNQCYDQKVMGESFGATLIAVANAQQIKKDIQFTAGIAMTVLLILLVLFYKKLTIPIILFLPTLFGCLVAISFLYLLRTRISAISLGIGSVLIGVTLDYALHILTHIRNGNPISNLYKEVAPSILMSALTTAAAFLCLLFVNSQALQDLGIFAAVSVLGASIFALLVIPQIYRTTVDQEKKHTVLDRLASYDFGRSRWAIGLVALLLITSVFTHNRVIFNKDIAKLNFVPRHLEEAMERLDALTDIGSKSVYLASYGTDIQKVLQANDSLYQKLIGLQKEQKILGFSSAGALVKSDKLQQSKIKAWENFWDSQTLKSVQENLIESGVQLGFKPTTFNKFYALLNADFKPLRLDHYNVVNTFTIDDYIATQDNFTTVTTLVKVDPLHLQEIKDTFKNSSHSLLIDRQGMNEAFLGTLKDDFNRLIGYSILAVLVILLLFFRSISLTLVTSVPIILTWLLTIGIMGVLHIEFNIFNIIISTFVFGMGVDYCIFVTAGLLAEYRTGEPVLSTHKTSIILSVITTILGVGVLIFAKHPALYSISLVSLIGILSAAFVAFTIQPMLFLLLIGSKDKRPISIRYLVHSVLSFLYFGLGGILFSLYGAIALKISQDNRNKKQVVFHKMASKLMKSVLYSNPFVEKRVVNEPKEDFKKPAMIIANHTSFLDSLVIRMLNPNTIFLVNKWVYNSPIFGSAAQLAGDYPVYEGLEDSEEYLNKRVKQGFSLMAFPEGKRSQTHKIKRFHKGAFHLAEQMKLDVLPVLIHGNSEVLPRGSFIIKDGSISVKILDRIAFEDKSFGTDSRERTRNIGTHMRNEFLKFRREIEHETYFHKLVLEDFRYKGDEIYKEVRKDLKTNKAAYKKMIDIIGQDDKVLHLSKNKGQLDFLLALDSIDRKIIRYISNPNFKSIFANSFITQNYQNIQLADSNEDLMLQNGNVLICDSESLDLNVWETKIRHEIGILIILNGLSEVEFQNLNSFGFRTNFQNDSFIILKK